MRPIPFRSRIKARETSNNQSLGAQGLDYVTLNPSAAKNFWIPDIFIDQAKELRIPTYFVRPASIRVYKDSRIRYATRVNFDVACKMEFHRYPHDVQTCEIKLESFGYTNRQMRFNWMSGKCQAVLPDCNCQFVLALRIFLLIDS